MPAADSILHEDSGVLTFGNNCLLSSIIFTDTSWSFSFKPVKDSSPVTIKLDFGEIGSVTQVTQFSSPSSFTYLTQDGYTEGFFTVFTIDIYGTISDLFSKGVSIPLYNILITTFLNPDHLQLTNVTTMKPQLPVLL